MLWRGEGTQDSGKGRSCLPGPLLSLQRGSSNRKQEVPPGIALPWGWSHLLCLNCQPGKLAGKGEKEEQHPTSQTVWFGSVPSRKGDKTEATGRREYARGREWSPQVTHIVGCNVLDGMLHSVVHYHHCHPSPSYIALPHTCHVDVPARAPAVILQEKWGRNLVTHSPA